MQMFIENYIYILIMIKEGYHVLEWHPLLLVAWEEYLVCRF